MKYYDHHIINIVIQLAASLTKEKQERTVNGTWSLTKDGAVTVGKAKA